MTHVRLLFSYDCFRPVPFKTAFAKEQVNHAFYGSIITIAAAIAAPANQTSVRIARFFRTCGQV